MKPNDTGPKADLPTPGPVFLALPIGAASRVRLGALCDRLRGELPGVRWVPPGNLHITLRYFGRVKPRRLAAIMRLAGEAAAGAGATGAVLNRVGWFGRRPRVLWAGSASASGRLAAFAEAMEAAFPKPGPHPFALHVTLGRFPERVEKGTAQAWQEALSRLAADPSAGWGEAGPVRCRFGELVLYESVPIPGGVRHEPLERWRLGGQA